jgi:thioredoxin reductase
VAIVGAGPYGLSIAAHLRSQGVDIRIFGSPMQSWRTQMPAGMLLKSEGFASNLADPADHLTLKCFCEEMQLPYADIGLAVPLETMAAYGLTFQRRLVPEVEEKTVVSLDRSWDTFVLSLDNGERVKARHVVVAAGMSHYQHVPPVLTSLPPELVSHSSNHHELRQFSGRDVTVIGGGASALDVGAALREVGAEVRIVARRSSISFTPLLKADRSLWQRIRYPVSGIGFGVRSRFYTDAALLFHFLPPSVRLRTVRSYLGPAGGPHVRKRIVGRVPLVLGFLPSQAEQCGGRVRLRIVNGNGIEREVMTDHVIAATGYVVDIRRLRFLSESLQSQLRAVAHTPILDRNFQSSVPGLYFVGLTSANSFGPMMRFVFGSRFTARRLSKHLVRPVASRARGA